MKKKIKLTVLIMLLAITLTGCNMSLGIGNFSFEKVHVDTHNYSGCLEIEKWYDNSTGIEILTKENGYMFLSEGMYILIEKECPFCANKN